MANASRRYGVTLMTLHWAMLLLIVAVYATIELRELFPRGSDPREAMKTWHFMLGLSVLCVAGLRLVVSLTSKTPAITPLPPFWQTRLAKLVHFAIYGLMLGLPVLGWFVLSAAGKPIPFFGLELPPLVAPDKEWAGTLKGLHESIAVVGYGMLGAHAAAALFHHYVMHDNTLVRMLPGR